MLKKSLFYILGFLFSFTVHAEEKSGIYPSGCKPVSFEFLNDQLVLAKFKKNPKQRLFLIKNSGKNNIWLEHPVKNPSASAGWSSQLNIEQWSAFALKRNNFVFACVESLPSAQQYISCQETLIVCEMEKVTFKPENLGNYWVGENLSLENLLATIHSRGIELL
ncbi:MAG: hypothetical protein JSS53_00355 [Proteobacteria bacterium]|nr:hypothetical protein [Pseudomonadota bacterium]